MQCFDQKVMGLLLVRTILLISLSCWLCSIVLIIIDFPKFKSITLIYLLKEDNTRVEQVHIVQFFVCQTMASFSSVIESQI